MRRLFQFNIKVYLPGRQHKSQQIIKLSQLLIMNLTFKEKFLEQKNIEQTLYGKFGYHNVDQMGHYVEKVKNSQQNYPITANIKLRRVTPSLYRNEKIDQVQQEIQQIYKDRKRREEEAKLAKNPEDLDKYVKKMEHLIDKYNYFIDHKHIKEKGTDQARKMLNIQPKTQAEKALEQITELKQKLKKANISEQINLTKKINTLYRLFKDKIDEPVVDTLSSPRTRVKSQYTKQNLKTTHFRVMSRAMQDSQRASSIVSRPKKELKSLKNKLNNTMGFSLREIAHPQNPQSANYLNISLNENHLKKVQSTFERANEKKSNTSLEKIPSRIEQNAKINYEKEQKLKKKIEASINQPYVEKKFIQNSKKMDVQLRNNQDALELWKGRIAEAVPSPSMKKNSTKRIVPVTETKNQRQPQLNDSDFDLREHVPYVENTKYFKDHETVESLKAKNQKKEQILSSLLQKRHSKYTRPWGTKILVKYNPSKDAKQMLGLSPKKNRNEEIEQRQKSKSLVGKLQEKLQLPLNILKKDGEDEEGYKLDWDEEIDQEFYWTMCKNEKINLLLKGKGR